MSVESEIIRLQTAKADLKTSIEDKGVTVPSSTKLDGYVDLVDSISGGGGTAPYIVNPLNGVFLGTSTSVGAVTHQYQINGGTISECYIASTSLSHNTGTGGSGFYNNASWDNAWLKELFGSSTSVTISDQGLLTYNFNRSQSQVNEYNWLVGNYINVIIKLDNGLSLTAYFHTYNHYTCLIKDTNIVLANKTNKKIQDITYDDELLVWNFDDGKYDSAKPLWIKKTETTTWYYKLKFSNGLELKVTGTYPEAHSLFSVEDGKFIHANKLVSKKVYTLDGIATLESCEEVHENVEFYNIITNYHMNLFANSVLTSTSLNNLYPIKNMVFVKEDREPTFDYSMVDRKWVNGLRLSEQPKDVTDYCNNLIKLQLKN